MRSRIRTSYMQLLALLAFYLVSISKRKKTFGWSFSTSCRKKNYLEFFFRKNKNVTESGFELLTMRLWVRCAIHSAILTLTIWSQNIWFIYVLQFRTVSVAQLPTPYPIPDSKSPYQGLSESVVAFSGTFHFTRLDSGEQWIPNHSPEIRGFC